MGSDQPLRIEQIARDLGMSLPDPKKTVIVVLEDGASPARREAGK